jgi:hypothetical protein
MGGDGSGRSSGDFVSEDAAALVEASERKDHRVDLVGIGVDPPAKVAAGKWKFSAYIC